MQETIFTDKRSTPSEKDIQDALLESHDEWTQIQNYVESNYGPFKTEWKFYTQRSGWLRKTMLKKRNLFFFKPCKGRFVLTFVFGEKAVEGISRSKISGKIVEEIANAKKHAEGRSISIEVMDDGNKKDVQMLIDHKIQF